MPIFEYRCKNCGEKFETLVFSSQTKPVKCEKCGSEQTEKLMSTFASGGVSGSGSGYNSGGCSPSGGFS